uniref:Uncharacterized protein n=1 Tax=Anguilla anguilla TaxID=7936 RepID=A0A0E9XVR9_ANGAN
MVTSSFTFGAYL